ncbi:Zinc finger with UFM1-specific peptidase domain protein [Cyphellophora attinorum]|uniref:Zinc finger with UFM1-specific peptidase domain protein n=1 Tax=Cyphellophora attinorum TaxID=1664694 RepID=A0A0N1GZP2_9EURO|nr:Zinc finger with UFM1-specific peptidase domain protein [Phialophora attinorum]KPI36750.1 Zinc finger with UFM1-specific peptidase domain protein [Phialophora attinorum]
MDDIRTYFTSSPMRPSPDTRGTILTCPFCPIRRRDFDELEQHVQTTHFDQIEAPPDSKDGQSDLSDAELAQLLAFEEAGIPAELAQEQLLRDASTSTPNNDSDADLWIDCFCGERILLEEIDMHSDMHKLEFEDGEGPEDHKSSAASSSNGYSSTYSDAPIAPPQSLLASLPNGAKARRLGKSELGPYAYEDRMPNWLHEMLSNNVGVTLEEVHTGSRKYRYSALANETSLLIPKLQALSRADNSVIRSAFCKPVVNHVSKLPKEGGFCGYRNIQMMISYIRGSHLQDKSRMFKGSLPTIFELQHAIESAWDAGFNAVGRVETGGIKNTRKYIGTSEASALFQSKGIACRAESFTDTKGSSACDAMLACMTDYFSKRSEGRTNLAPVYLQYKGHSLTCVGFEEVATQDGTDTNLMIFDPMYRIPQGLKKMSVDASKPESKLHFLRAFRYPRQRFKRFKEFELLFLDE